MDIIMNCEWGRILKW